MNKFIKTYGSTTLLLIGIILGLACGALFKDKVLVVKPIGDIFLNFLFTLVVPLVFFSISSSFCKMRESGIAGKVFGVTAVVFVLMLAVSSIVAYFGCAFYNPLGEVRTAVGQEAPSVNISDSIVSSFSVSDFSLLFSKSNLLPLIVFSIALGVACPLCGESGKKMAEFLEAGCNVTMKIIDFVMFVAPVGLGCYIACVVASMGDGLITGYLRCVVLYLAMTVLFFVILQPLCIFVVGGSKHLKAYWQNILPPSLTALATGFSIIAIPGNIEVLKKMNVRQEIAEGIMPLGINIHKDGSAISSTIKIVFILSLLGMPVNGFSAALTIIGVALISSIVMGAIPGGGATGELLICAILGIDPTYAGIMIVIATLIDLPATMINSSGNVVATYLVDRLCKRENSQPQKV